MVIDPAQIPPEVTAVCRRLHTAGFAAYLVGGAVRDLLRGQQPSDWDVATSARPEEVLGLFPESLPTGLKYGTVTVFWEGVRVEVTTFRAEEAYTDGRHPDRVVFGVSLVEDLARRDFTVNAMAYDPLTGHLIDPYGGRRDLARKIVRPVGDPARRFQEDALRMLRLYRFAATLAMRPDSQAEKAIVPSLLAPVSPERIRDELG
ncbi:MAG: CCA tRNA nucleotidyltransferase, partial [Firmicutes bacterium]|nr:CCA tRNA nucleotidyltransferase [Bacillota bacterium]